MESLITFDVKDLFCLAGQPSKPSSHPNVLALRVWLQQTAACFRHLSIPNSIPDVFCNTP
eukprot:831123-Pelagomonas_calceolata.AAC.1